MTEDEVDGLISFLFENPDAGDEVKGTGGRRKARVAGRGKGKSGGYRTITFFSGRDSPVFLLTVFGKGERADLTQAERNALKGMTGALVSQYRNQTVKRRSP